jgi:hypothetical protein
LKLLGKNYLENILPIKSINVTHDNILTTQSIQNLFTTTNRAIEGEKEELKSSTEVPF